MTEIDKIEEFKVDIRKALIAIQDEFVKAMNQIREEFMSAKKIMGNIIEELASEEGCDADDGDRAVEGEDYDVKTLKNVVDDQSVKQKNQNNMLSRKENENCAPFVKLLPQPLGKMVEPKGNKISVHTVNLESTAANRAGFAVQFTNGALVHDEFWYVTSHAFISIFFKQIPKVDLGVYMTRYVTAERGRMLGLHNCLLKCDYVSQSCVRMVFDEMLQPRTKWFSLIIVYGYHSKLILHVLPWDCRNFVIDPGFGLILTLRSIVSGEGRLVDCGHAFVVTANVTASDFFGYVAIGSGVEIDEDSSLNASSLYAGYFESGRNLEDLTVVKNLDQRKDEDIGPFGGMFNLLLMSNFQKTMIQRAAHFIPLSHPYTVASVAQAFIEVVKLHSSIAQTERIPNRGLVMQQLKCWSKWKNQPMEDASWEFVYDLIDFLLFRLEDKPFLMGEGLMQDIHRAEPSALYKSNSESKSRQ